jgi:hypothetical protein
VVIRAAERDGLHCPLTATIESPLVGVAFGNIATIARAWRMLTENGMTGRKNCSQSDVCC